MNKSYSRLDRVNALLLQEFSDLLNKEVFVEGEDLLITFTKVVTSPDLKQSRVYFTVFPDGKEKKAEIFLNKKRGKWQKILSGRLSLKYFPCPKFLPDKGMANLVEVEKILSQLEKS